MRAMAKVFVLAWFCLVGLLAFSGRALAAEPVKIGILGLDNYQAVAFTQLFNTPQEAEELQGVRVVVAWPGTVSEDIPESVQRLPEWTKAMEQFQVAIVDSVDACLARCDAVLVMPLDGRRHRSLAEAALKAGKPTYIGRPLAHNFSDAVAILQLADDRQVRCWTSSQHRFSPGFLGMRNHPEVGQVLGADVYG
ncbi:MAG: Gfo/Idh/MocA family oxidoreductase, partial [Planctomycetaceae bacterium]